MTVGGIVYEPGSMKKNKTGSWRSVRPVLNKAACIGCKMCEMYCPDGCIEVKADKKAEVDYDYCKGCGICAQLCPKKAITMAPECGEKMCKEGSK